ncbi:MAG: SagB/ThcOx family dehydrogenase [Syntrophobacteraceae bacterium]|nr:SagB/ThcOx family dehydrogenase [Syntrophobacteraceae bacterium]
MKSLMMSHYFWLLLGVGGCAACLGAVVAATPARGADPSATIQLPEPRAQGTMPLETAIQLRRSVRSFAGSPLSLADVGQLLWSAQGITLGAGLRAAPSAGALYPLETDLVAVRVDGLEPGVYRYIPKTHTLARRASGDKGSALGAAALRQSCVSQASAVVVLSAVYERTTRKYGQRGIRYVHAEAGHAAQNVCLQAVALQLGTVHIGAFHDEEVSRVLQLAEDEKPLVLLPVGRPERRGN